MDYEALCSEIKACRKCSTRQEAAAPVLAEGSLNASVFVIGRAPGKEEDIQCRPFVGNGGKQLNKLLVSIGLERSDCYITNMVKCYPMNDRANTDEEIENCRGYLQHEQ